MIWETVDSDRWLMHNSYQLGIIKKSPTSLRHVEWQAYVDFDNADYLDIFQAMAFSLVEIDLVEAVREKSDLL